MLNRGRADPETISRIVNGTPLVLVEVYRGNAGDFVDVNIVTPSPTPPTPPTTSEQPAPTESYTTTDTGFTVTPTDQSELVTQRVAVNGYRLLSRVSPGSLDSFSCEKSDYQNMFVCANETKTGSGKKEIYRRLTFTFNQNTGQLFYIFSLQKQPGTLGYLSTNEIRRITKLVGPPKQHLVSTLPGDRHPSHIVYWGSIELNQIDDDARRNVLSALPTGKGYLVDYELSLRYSAQNNYPIYFLSGDAGFILNYRMDDDGTERIATRLVVPKAFTGEEVATPTVPLPTPEVTPVPSPTPQVTPIPVPPPTPVCELPRRQRLIDSANTLLADLDFYLKLHPETPDIASVAQEDSRLQSAVNREDCPTIEATTQTLKRRMEKVPGFAEFEHAQNEEREKGRIRALGEAVTLASKHQQFLRKQIAEEVTSPNTPALATFLNEYESILRRPDLSTVTNLNDRLKKLVSEKEELKQAYDAFMAGPAPNQPEPKPPSESVTDRNRFLMAGELTDWVLLFNAGGKAPHVARNIRGDIVFEGQQADACILHPAAGKIEAAQVEDILSAYRVDTVRLDPSPCPETKLESQDVLIALRGEFLKQPPSYSAPLLGLVEDGTFQELKTLTSEEFEKSTKARELEATLLENEIFTGTRDGYGLIKIDNGSAVICMTTAEQEATHRALINDQRKVLLRSFKVVPEIQPTTVEAGFIAAERGQCGAIYAGRSDLAEAIQAFRRDNIRYSIVPLWFEPKLVADRVDEIRREKDRLAQEEQDRKRKKEEEAALAKQRGQDYAEQKERREAELQAQHGPQARARAEEIATAIKLLAEKKESWAEFGVSGACELVS